MKNSLLWLSLVVLSPASPQTLDNQILSHRLEISTTLTNDNLQSTLNTVDFPHESLQTILNKEAIFRQAIRKVIGGKSIIEFDTTYVGDKIYTILDICFDMSDKDIIYMKPDASELQQISQIIETMRKHIKKDAWRKGFLFSPSRFQDFLNSKGEKFYENLVEFWKFQYSWGKKQFIVDFRSIIIDSRP